MTIPQKMLVLSALLCCLTATADDYILPAGDADALSEEVTYGTMTVAGDLSAYVPGGTAKSVKKITVASLNLDGGTVTIDPDGGSQYFGLGLCQTSARGGTAVSVAEDGGRYGFITVKNINAALDIGLGAEKITIAKEGEGFSAADGIVDIARIENGALFVRQLYNDSSYTGRVTIAGGGISFFGRRGASSASSFVTKGPFIVRLQDNSTWNFGFYNNRGAVNAENQALQCIGDGDVIISSRKYNGNDDAHIRNGAFFNHRGVLTLAADGANEASFNIDAGNIIGPNVTKLVLTDDTVILADGITLKVPDVESSANAVLTVADGGVATVQIDATEQVRTASLNIAANAKLTVEKLGPYDLAFTATANIPTLKLHDGVARFASDCTIQTLDCADGGCVVAEDGAVVLIENGAAAMAGTLTPGASEWPEGEHVVCYYKGEDPDLTKVMAPSIVGKTHVVAIVDGTGVYEGWKALKLTVSAVTPVGAIWVGEGEDDAVTTSANWLGSPKLDFGNGSVEATFAASGNHAEVTGLAWFKSILLTAQSGFTIAKGDVAAAVGVCEDGISATGTGSYAFEPPISAFADTVISAGPDAKIIIGNGIVAENGQVVLTATDAGAEIELHGTNVISGRLHATDTNAKLTLSGLVTNPDGVDARGVEDIKGVDEDFAAFAFKGTRARSIYLDNITMEKAFCATTADTNNGRSLWALENTTNRFCACGSFFTSWGTVYAARGSWVIFERDVLSGNGFGKYGDGTLSVRGKLTTRSDKTFQIRAGTVRVECPEFQASNMDMNSYNASESEICRLEFATNVVNAGSVTLGSKYANYVECQVKIDTGCEVGLDAIAKSKDSRDDKARVTGEEGSVLCLKNASVLDIRMFGKLGVKADCGMVGAVVLTNRDYMATGPLIAQSGILELDSTASWAGTNLVVRGVSADRYGTLRIASNGNFQNRRLCGVIEGKGKFELASGVRLSFDSLMVDGMKVAPGIYTKNSPGAMAGHIVGDGCVNVRGGGLMIIVK